MDFLSASALSFLSLLILIVNAAPIDDEPTTIMTKTTSRSVGSSDDSSEGMKDVIESDVPTTEPSLFFDPDSGFQDQLIQESLRDGHYEMDHPDLFQGDIISDFPSETKTAVRVFNLWPLGLVPYSMDFSLFPMRDKIRAAMNEIEEKTCIKFRPRLFSRDYVNMGSGSGCYSVIGRSGGPQILSLGRGCQAHTTIVHELLHAIGFEHMHSHRDRDVFLKIRWENIPRDKWRQFEVVSLLGYKTLVPFDFESVMLYGPRTFGQDGKISMESKIKGRSVMEMSQKPGLSKGDVDGINRLYMCRRNGKGEPIHL